MSKIYLLGHKNPDTDAIITPLVYEFYLKSIGQDAEAIKIGPINKETEFLLKELELNRPRRVDSLPAGSKVFLLDHNEKRQSIDNIDKLEIIGLIDHHKIGDFITSNPLFVRMDTLGSSCSVLHHFFKEKWFDVPANIAKAMISAIISDTLFFRSPTTTDEDKKIVEELNKIAWIEDLEEYSLNMFNAKSNLWDIPANEIVKMDFKEFDMWNKRVWLGVMETTNPGYALWRKDEILEAMEYIKKQDELDIILFFSIDILNQINTAFVLWEKEKHILKEVFDIESNEQLADLGNRISRKKQIVPQLGEYFMGK